jgi:hypothetical protein
MHFVIYFKFSEITNMLLEAFCTYLWSAHDHRHRATTLTSTHLISRYHSINLSGPGIAMKSALDKQFIEFLQRELSISSEEIGLALRHQELTITQLPILLWQYGLISIQQLEKIFDWQEQISFSPAGT